ncbi:MAG TPA: hypothetical protein PLL64_12150, partial [Rhodothermales bacterium]|nr:hypothetical protein [Rhodothermales bacterium]
SHTASYFNLNTLSGFWHRHDQKLRKRPKYQDAFYGIRYYVLAQLLQGADNQSLRFCDRHRND